MMMGASKCVRNVRGSGRGGDTTDASRDNLNFARACSTLCRGPGQSHPSVGYHEKSGLISTTSKLSSEAKYHMLNVEVMSLLTYCF